MDWRRTGAALTSWATTSATRSYQARSRTAGDSESFSPAFGSGKGRAVKHVAAVAAGDRVLHATFGMGTVVATSGAGDAAKADVDFGSMGMKRLSLKHAPMEKL